jgi:hypothetical protein
MQAMNGSAAPGRRRGRRLLGCVIALVALSAMIMPSIASATTVPIKATYLCLGNSLAFGYSQQLFNENEKLGEPPTAFEHGYCNDYLKLIHGAAQGVQLTNDGCPGETTDSMIGNGLLAAAFGIPGESPCPYHYVLGFPLHHEYGDHLSQLESALGTIAVDSFTGKPVTTISLDIGANDELHQIKACEKEVTEEFTGPEHKSKYGSTPEEAVKNCISAHVEGLFKHIEENIGRILFAIREGSKFGGVNYTGKIIFQGGYNPFGNVCGSSVTCSEKEAAVWGGNGIGEILKGTNELEGLLNLLSAKTVAKFGACFSDPQTTFNPENSKEPVRLKKWTNMANFTEFEGKKNGPDIHPTPEGYNELAKLMKKECP